MHNKNKFSLFMDIKNEYKKLYQYWLKEFKNKDLTPLTKELFTEFKRNFQILNEPLLNEANYGENKKIKSQIIDSYRENFKFLFNDFLKIREIKILNSALALQEINLDNLLQAEKLFYRNLVSDIKGYKKVKAMSIYEEVKEEEIKSMFELKENGKIETSKGDESYKISDIEDIKKYLKTKGDDFDYVLIRFLKKTPPLVGIDLINYGPFQKEDIAYMPSKNAKILLNEKFAEKIEPS
jgi:DNA replication initiation complex subunit (GINS family)